MRRSIRKLISRTVLRRYLAAYLEPNRDDDWNSKQVLKLNYEQWSLQNSQNCKFFLKQIRSAKEDIFSNRKKSNKNSTKGLTFNSVNQSYNQTEKNDSESFASSNPTQYDFSLKSDQTKKAEIFIKKIQQEQW